MLTQFKPLLTQAKKTKRGRKAQPRPIYVSRKLELDYARALLAIIDDMHKETLGALMPLVSVGDSVMVADGLFSRVKTTLSKVGKAIKDKVTGIASALAKMIVGKQKAASDKQLADMLFKQTGIDFSGLMADEALTEAVTEAVAANVALINSIPQQYLDRVEQAVMAGLQSGTLNTTLADELAKIEGITKSRAQLIASDQLGKINSRLAQIRQQSLGITHYTWSTSQDERVRGNPAGKYPKVKYSHHHRHGKRIAWDDPPPDGHAGQAIRCRCVAIPDLSDIVE